MRTRTYGISAPSITLLSGQASEPRAALRRNILEMSVLQAIGNTPLVPLANINGHKLGVRVLVKLEGNNPGGSIKDRPAYYMVKQAEETGALTPSKTIVEATSGNTGIALACLGYLKGYKVTIAMPESMSLERRRLLKIYKANLILTPGSKGVMGSINTVNEMVAKDDRYFMANQFANPANPLTHYETTGLEIIQDFPYDKIDVFVAGVGTGGTIMGVARRLKEKYPGVKVIGVEPPLGDPVQGLRCLEEYVPPVMDMKILTERTFVTSRQAIEGTRLLLDKEGIFAGMSSGAAAYRAVQLAQEIDEGNIVTILPDGGWKYLGMDLWTTPEQ